MHSQASKCLAINSFLKIWMEHRSMEKVYFEALFCFQKKLFTLKKALERVFQKAIKVSATLCQPPLSPLECHVLFE